MNMQTHINNHIQSTQSVCVCVCAFYVMQWILFIAASTKNGFYFSISRYDRRGGVVTADADMFIHLFLYIFLFAFLFVYRYCAR